MPDASARAVAHWLEDDNMLDRLTFRALSKPVAEQFHQHSVSRMRPVVIGIMSFAIFAYLLFAAGRCVLLGAVEPFVPALAFSSLLVALLWVTLQANHYKQFGLAGVTFLGVLQIAVLANTVGIKDPLLWLLPAALLLPICSAPFWITRGNFLSASLFSYGCTISYVVAQPLTRDEIVIVVVWYVIGFPSATALHWLCYGYRLQHFALEHRLANLAATDSLTGLINRRSFLERAEIVISQCDATGQCASALFIDVDHFKSINDNFGHHVGDQVLKTVATVLASQTRPTDILGRMGGEEFAILIPSCPLAQTMELAERLREKLGEIRRPDGMLTASLGVAEYLPGENLVSLLDRADRAMLDAKHGGRNRVAVATDDVASHQTVRNAARPVFQLL